MKAKLISLILNAVSLLEESNWASQAQWFRDMSSLLGDAQEESEQFIDLLSRLDKAICGMGSFDDIRLCIRGKSYHEVRHIQTALVERIGSIV